jgi:pyruvate kinase
MRRLRRAKIVATLGPSSSEATVIQSLFEAGADVFRINMSHTTHDRMRELVRLIRSVEKKSERPVGVLVDLQGPKLRIGSFEGDAVMLERGATFVLDSDPRPGDVSRVQLPHPEILAALEPGHTLLLDDGKVRLTAIETAPGRAVTRVEVGGKLSNRKGISLPDTTVAFSALTAKDRSDLEAALDAGIDWIALSFIQRPEDVAEAKKITRGRAAVMAKIEKPQAVTRLAEILDLVDALMVARGDLGVEMPLEKVPGVQKQITRMTRRAGKPVVVATQMLESMISNPVPTRAEVSDVATAVFEGADAIMLSAESAAGKYPVESVAMMNRIAEEVEGDPTYRSIVEAQRAEPEATGSDAIAAAARGIAETLVLSAVVCWTSSGSTALRVARERPKSPIIAISPNLSTGRKLSLVWGVHCVIAQDARDLDDMVDRACRMAVRDGFAKVGQRIIIVAGVPLGTPGATNMVRIAFVGDEAAENVPLFQAREDTREKTKV